MTTSIDATEDEDNADIEAVVDAEAAVVVVVGELDGVATDTVVVGSAEAAELDVWIENGNICICSFSCLELRSSL